MVVLQTKGFTLIELLAVILVITLLLILVVPVISNVINASREELYEVKIANIEAATEIWAADHTAQLPEEEGEVVSVSLATLQADGYIAEDIKNPITGAPFSEDLTIEIELKRNSYRYQVID